MKFKLVKITDTGVLYCAIDQMIYRYNLNNGLFEASESIDAKGEVEDIVAGHRFVVAIVRLQPDEVKLRIFDNNEPLNNFSDAKTPFELGGMKTDGHLVMGRFNCYFIHN